MLKKEWLPTTHKSRGCSALTRLVLMTTLVSTDLRPAQWLALLLRKDNQGMSDSCEKKNVKKKKTELKLGFLI